MSAAVALPVDVEVSLLRKEAAEELERARQCGRMSDAEGVREARGRAADLQRKIRALEQSKQK